MFLFVFVLFPVCSDPVRCSCVGVVTSNVLDKGEFVCHEESPQSPIKHEPGNLLYLSRTGMEKGLLNYCTYTLLDHTTLNVILY